MTTLPDPKEEFQLQDFRITISRNNPMGSGTATWVHHLPCVDRFAIRLVRNDDPDVKGEMFVPAPDSVGQEVFLDLHMVPGILNLQNCRTYTLHVFPDNFPELVSDPGKWHSGVNVTFDYVSPGGEAPNEVDLDEVVKVVADFDRAEIVWGDEAFTCSEVELLVSSLRFLYRKHAHLEEVRDLVSYRSICVILDCPSSTRWAKP